MRTFEDSKKESWELALTFGSIKRLKGLLEVDLLDLLGGDPPLLTRLGTEVTLLVDVICALVRPQLAARELSDEDFAERLDGVAAKAAMEAFYAELADFTRNLGQTAQARAVERQTEVLVKEMVRKTELVNLINLNAAVDKEISRVSEELQNAGLLSTDAPESSGSTPTP